MGVLRGRMVVVLHNYTLPGSKPPWTPKNARRCASRIPKAKITKGSKKQRQEWRRIPPGASVAMTRCRSKRRGQGREAAQRTLDRMSGEGKQKWRRSQGGISPGEVEKSLFCLCLAEPTGSPVNHSGL